MMRFACMTSMAPGSDLAAQCAAIAAAGCQAIETIVFPATRLELWVEQVRRATTTAGLAAAAVILGELALDRPGQLPWIGEALAAIGELGAAALITPEYRAQDPLPLWPPFPQPTSTEQATVAQAVSELITRADVADVTVLLEPVTQFEGRYWRTLHDVTAVCQQLSEAGKASNFGVVIDFHNMNITEAAPLAAMDAAFSWIKHVHLADSNRRLPGRGHIDFYAALQALQGGGYDGWYSFECAADEPFALSVGDTIAQLRRMTQGG